MTDECQYCGHAEDSHEFYPESRTPRVKGDTYVCRDCSECEQPDA